MVILLLAMACTQDPPPTDTDADTSAVISDEICDNRLDDDGDGDTDCDDTDCVDFAACVPAEVCTDGVDNDRDGDTDCDDADCVDDLACIPATETDCSDGVDDDRDSLTDCSDPDCTDACDEVCHNGVDDDADGLVDCLDDECADASVCVEDCSDGIDNDQDGFLDCEDADCYGVGPCVEDCTDETDNDRDGHIDCDDSDCWGTTECLVRTVVVTGGHLETAHDYSAGIFYSAGHYSYSSAVSQDIWASSVTGRFVYAWGSTTTSCSWGISYAHLSAQYNMRYDPVYGLRTGGSKALAVQQRDGFTTGGCAGSVGTSVFPTSFELAPGSVQWVGESYWGTTTWGRPGWVFRKGQWYGGSVLSSDGTYQYTNLGRGTLLTSTSQATVRMSTGDAWTF
jgi:hypothetical protein